MIEVASGIRNRSVAVVSGKGGVGKTTTAVNLAVWAARQGYHTALVDLDPLSDAAVLLDLRDVSEGLKKAVVQRSQTSEPARIDSIRIGAYPDLDILQPYNAGFKDPAAVKTFLFETSRDELINTYDLFVFDMSAGSEEAEHLSFLPLVGPVILVTNPDPASHVAAGSYLRRLQEHVPEKRGVLWINRFRRIVDASFDPGDPASTYNANVTEDLTISEKLHARFQPVAFVPEDPAMNLLRGAPPVNAYLIEQMQNALGLMVRDYLETLLQDTDSGSSAVLSRTGLELAVDFFAERIKNQAGGTSRIEQQVQDFEEYLLVLSERIGGGRERGNAALTGEQRRLLSKALEKAGQDSFIAVLRRCEAVLREGLDAAWSQERLFAVEGEAEHKLRPVDREVAGVLVQAAGVSGLRRSAGLLLAYYSAYKLFQSETVVKLITGFIPYRSEGNRRVRDRRIQIANLAGGGGAYRKGYLELVKRLSPVYARQVGVIAEALSVRDLLFRDSSGTVVREAYLRLLSSMLHEIVHSGLSIIIGFDYRPAADAFNKGAERVIELLDVPAPQTPAV
ncbi:MAG: AAA family ATPase [Spirochaetales bacterium]|nr:AAA family ATPase [Spirochaetales bacterium]MCF7937407.1 AAA family ATPase [Spirochaetales bacterium]